MSQVERRDEQSTKNDLLEFLETTAGEALRTVLYYDSSQIEQLYVRPDVGDRYEGSNAERIHREQVLENINKEYVENLFSLGELDCTVQRFEDAVVIRVMEDDSGVLVSVDRHAGTDLNELMDGAVERLA